MKILIIYYSLNGNTKLIADNIAYALNADLLELKDNKPAKSNLLTKYIYGTKEILFNKSPQLLPFEINVFNYDILFIGTPVWAGNYAPILNTFLKSHILLNNKIAFFACCTLSKGKVFKNLKKDLSGNTFLGEKLFFNPRKINTKKNSLSAREWAREIISKI